MPGQSKDMVLTTYMTAHMPCQHKNARATADVIAPLGQGYLAARRLQLQLHYLTIQSRFSAMFFSVPLAQCQAMAYEARNCKYNGTVGVPGVEVHLACLVQNWAARG